MLWGEQTKGALSRVPKNKTVIVPIGSIEAHGNHLPVGTDSYIVEFLAKRIAEKLNCLAAPAIIFGPCETMLSFTGTITISEKICQQMTFEIIESIIHHGFKKIFILNGHGGNDVFLKKIVDQFSSRIRIKTKNWYDFKFIKRLKEQDQTYLGDHADKLETEIMIGINNKLVKMEFAVDEVPDWPKNYKNLTDYSDIMKHAVDGFPTTASKKRGKQLLKIIINALCEEISN